MVEVEEDAGVKGGGVRPNRLPMEIRSTIEKCDAQYGKCSI